MTPSLNVGSIYAAMQAKGWGKKNTCVECGMAIETLNKILAGKVPRRIDSLFRLCEGLGIPMRELFVFPASDPDSKTAELALRRG
jgi:transcriptional regulator with XRE-family HTH domain